MNPHLSAQLVTEHRRELTEFAAPDRRWRRAPSRKLAAFARRGQAEPDPTLVPCCT